MKYKILILALIASVAFSSCEDKLGEVADFSSTKAPYVELTAKTALAVKEGATANVAIRTRENFQKDVVVTYDVTGAITKTGTATIPRNTLAGTISIAVPAGTITGTATTATAVVTLKSAVMGTTALTIGYGDAALEKRTLNISK